MAILHVQELAAKSDFELVNLGAEAMDFMKDKTRLYSESAKRLNPGK
ncbi:MAG: hypothetical protein ABI920_11905 [Casimicrobiaceae bacterium]